jgi:hypothetical protein
MKEFSHFTEEDFQSYFDKSFADDTNALENHLRECALCSKTFKAYSLVWSFAKNDLQTEPLRIDLAAVVASKAFAVEERKPVVEKLMYGMLICLGIISLSLCFNYLISRSMPTPFILLTIPFCLYLLLTYKEISIVNRKFTFH